MPPCQFGLTNEHDGPRLFRPVEVNSRAASRIHNVGPHAPRKKARYA